MKSVLLGGRYISLEVHCCRGSGKLSPLGLHTAVDFIGFIKLKVIHVFEGKSQTLNLMEKSALDTPNIHPFVICSVALSFYF